MRRSKFITILRRLDESEIRRFEHYLRAMHGGQSVAIKLFAYIRKYAPSFESDRLTQERAFSRVFGAKTQFNNKKLGNILSKLSQYLDEFLLWNQANSPSVTRDLELIRIYKDRGLEHLCIRMIDSLEKKMSENPQPDMWHYLQSMQLNYLSFFHVNSKKLQKGENRLVAGMENLDLFFSLIKLKYACEIYNRRNILEEFTEPYFMDDLKVHQEALGDALPRLHLLYARLLELMQYGKLEVYQEVKDLYVKHLKEFSPVDQLNILGYLINYAIARTRQNDPDYTRENFVLYDIGLSNNVLTNNGFISSTQFINIVIVACLEKEWDWLEDFLKNYKKYLLEKDRDNVWHFVEAYIAFAKKRFDEVIGNLSNVEDISDPAMVLRFKALQLRAYYEQYGRHDLVYDYAKSFELFLKRHKAKFNQNTFDAYNNLIVFVRKLIRKKINIPLLEEEIIACQALFFRSWLLEKIALLLKNTQSR